MLPAEEAAWKFRIELQRVKGFAPEEIWRVRGLPVPQRDRASGIVATTTRQGAELRLEVIGAGDPYGRGPGWRQPVPSLRVMALSAPPGLQITLLRATDDRGRAIGAHGPIPAVYDSAEYRFRLWRIPPGAKRMALTFAAHRNRFVEFLAKPARSSTGDNHAPGRGSGRPSGAPASSE
jgi:hypothetical protein